MCRIKRTTLWLTILILPFAAFGFSVHLSFITRVTGHEEITRQAIILTEFVAQKKGLDVSDDLLAQMTRIHKLPLGLESADIDIVESWGLISAENPIVFGNYAADKPDVADWISTYETDIFAKNMFPVGKDMLKWGGARSFHFTLNEYISDKSFNITDATPTYVGEISTEDVFYQSGAQACYDAKKYIEDFSQWGMAALAERAAIAVPAPPRRSLKNRFGFSEEYKAQKAAFENAIQEKNALLRTALFRFGVATHVIQDSFSPSHTFRSPEGGTASRPETPEYTNYDIIDVCYYDQVIPHAVTTAKEWAHNLALQSSRDDGLNDEDKVVLRPELRLAASRLQNAPCAHGKFDKNDNIWLSTDVQMDILRRQSWDEWEHEIWRENVVESTANQYLAAKLNLQKYCNHNRHKSSDFSAFICMKHEARLARTATVKYFLVLLEHYNRFRQERTEERLNSGAARAQLTATLDRHFFEGSNIRYTELGLNEIMPLGTMRCGNIKTPAYRRAGEKFSILN